MEDLKVEDLVQAGLSRDEAEFFRWNLQQVLRSAGSDAFRSWNAVSRRLLLPSHPFAVHQLVYYTNYKNWNVLELGPPPVWAPITADANSTNIGRMMKLHGRELFGNGYVDPVTNFRQLHELSVEKPEVYWKIILEELEIPFTKHPSCVLDTAQTEIDGEPCPGGKWLPGAVLNAAECCLEFSRHRKPHNVAILWRDEDDDDAPLKTMTLSQLKLQVCRVANGLASLGLSRGDPVAINMPMIADSVAIYLAIVLAGCVVVSIADSFSASEISTRLRISGAKAIFTQDVIVRSGKHIPLYTRVVEAGAPKAVVLPATSTSPIVPLRDTDLSWCTFLSSVDKFDAVQQSVEAFSNILFSSGTTGEPKAIPWTHATPIKAAADGWAHQDIRTGDVVAWPTNLGWMMGPWLVYASLVNGGTIALYNGSPLGRGFAKFVQDARVNMLGVIPSIVRHWKKTSCISGFDWSRVRCFSSTGEASTVDDNLWLMSQAGYKPIIEYCGGTEIGGGFVTGSMVQPQALSCFSTPAMGCEIVILDEAGHPLPEDSACIGECALNPSILGSSRMLLNASHFKVYYKGMPQRSGKILRRHGDEFERLRGGFYKAHGRVDDTMNLGGIKVSSVEIERICNAADNRVQETAAIGIPPNGGGPEKLFLIVVPKVDEFNEQLATELKMKLNAAVQQKLNPLFKVDSVILVTSLPRTASNKVMRRMLRSQYFSKSSL